MKITLETKSGQKYLLTRQELMEQFGSFLSFLGEIRPGCADVRVHKGVLRDFLETYEKEPEEESV